MAEFPALPLFTDAYLADTRHLNALQHGAYLLLLMMAWRLPECALPDDDKVLARWTAMGMQTWKRNKEIILAFWVKGPDGLLRQKRLTDERAQRELKRDKNIKAGKVSALKRHNTRSTDVPTEPQHKSNEPLSLKPKALSQIESKPPIPPLGECEAFEKFWKDYPKQRAGSRAKALAAWKRAIKEKRATEEEIQNGLEKYRGSDEVKRGYAKGAAAWINDDRWKSDYTNGILDGQSGDRYSRPNKHERVKAALRQSCIDLGIPTD